MTDAGGLSSSGTQHSERLGNPDVGPLYTLKTLNRRARVIAAIVSSRMRKKRGPSYREIQHALDLGHKNQAVRIVTDLCRAGIVQRGPLGLELVGVVQ